MKPLRLAAVALAALLHLAPARADDPPGLIRMSAEQQRTVKLQTTAAERRPITEPVHLQGTVMFDPGHVAVLRPFGQARVLRLLAQPGDMVAAGQKLAELDAPTLATAEQDLASARAAVGDAAASLAVAKDALRRGEILARDGSLARAEAERRRLLVAQGTAALELARTRAGALEAVVARLDPAPAPGVAQLASPIAGVVVNVGATPGEVIDAAREVFTVADLSVVLVLAQVPEASVPLVAVGDPAQVAPAGNRNRTWRGKVATLAAALDPQARTLPARIRLENPDGALRAGMAVDVTVTSSLGRDAVVVPAASVQMVADKSVVFTALGGDRFQSREIEEGVVRQDWIEARRGVAAGDLVVTQGSFELKALLQKALLGGG